jgi:uroporphyrinogen-III synthase
LAPIFSNADRCKSIGLSPIAQKNGLTVAYVSSSGYGNDLAKEIIPLVLGKRILYLRAKVVVSDLVSILENTGVEIHEKIVYETLCHQPEENIAIEKESIVIFSSPSTVSCFLKFFSWDFSYRAIAIGTTTADFISNNYKQIECKIAHEPNLTSCMQLALEMNPVNKV